MKIVTLERMEHLPQGARIYVYGAGGRGRTFVQCMRDAMPGIIILGFLDSFKSGTVDGYPLVQFTGMSCLGKHDAIIVASAFHGQIIPLLQRAGASDVRVLGEYYDYEYAMRQGRRLCVISANCQGGPVRKILNENPAFRERYYPVHYLNFMKQRPKSSEWKNCGLCIYQYLSEAWGELASDVMLRNMPGANQCVRIPKITWWPFWPTYFDDPRMLPEKLLVYANRPYGDKYLWDLYESGIDREECVRRYMEEDLSALYDIPYLVEANAEYLSSAENGRDIDLSIEVEKSITKSYCMYGYNHPSVKIHNTMVNKIFDFVGIVQNCDRDKIAKHDDFVSACIPIHPSIVEYFKLPYIENDMVYDLWGMRMTSEEYYSFYLSF